MGANFTPELIRLLRAAGCTLVRHGKGDHDIWESPINGRRFAVDGKIRSRHMANTVLKQAGLPQTL
ncbi:type II toxin-antitoxin system HicA family toxin [Allochromatium palmeri]|uniref:Addiction module toxin, HicA family n=1 Tax=Allochromatium palmeri TaxID=231048 RepID=A0A6N8E904_9GAMM|nr:type II toxin-antitoxin system HicA family toxin [Allochromatium palmeri]MTW20031.1 addiction module toxin, HicA family [Allochromatium palmeri]